MDARIGVLMREGRTVYYAFADGYNMPAFEGALEAVERRLGLSSGEVKQVEPGSGSRICRVKTWTVTMRFEHPAWDEKDGIEYRGVIGRNKSEANRAAARLAEGDGHAVTGRGRYWFSAVESEE